jgi:hypothetical protein
LCAAAATRACETQAQAALLDYSATVKRIDSTPEQESKILHFSTAPSIIQMVPL